ncbi:MAG: nicotinamide riboside transporter PnuC [Bacteroidota bacterium]
MHPFPGDSRTGEGKGEEKCMTELLEQIIAAGPLDWIALLTSLAYVFLAARDNNWCWFFAAISTAVWAYQSFVVYQLVSDGFLQLFYFVMAGIGLWQWQRMGKTASMDIEASPELLDSSALPERAGSSIQRMTLLEHVFVIVLGLIGGWLLHLFVSGIFTAAATLPDGITTSFSIITTFLLIWRKLENWLYWIVIDLIYVWLYGSVGANLFSLMMVINVGMAIYGFSYWRKELRMAKQVG